jgi:hypothetical protein
MRASIAIVDREGRRIQAQGRDKLPVSSGFNVVFQLTLDARAG